MAKPIINQIISFDAREPYTVTATYDGYLPIKNELKIKLDSKEVYSKEIITSNLSHTIPADKLKNGKQYTVTIRFTEEDGTKSSVSDPVTFRTLDTPDTWFTGQTGSTTTIEGSSYTATVKYTQKQKSKLYSYEFTLFDNARTKITSSGVKYNNRSGTIYLTHQFSNLDSEKYYYLVFEGVTDSNVPVHAEMRIFVTYEKLDKFTLFRVDCNTGNSHMNYKSYIKYIEPKRNNYEFNNGWIDLRGDYIEYEKGLLLNSDWCIIIRGYKLRRPTEILRLKNDKRTITFGGVLYTSSDFRFKLEVPNAIGSYILYTKPLDFNMNDILTIYIRKKDNIYSVNVKNEGDFAIVERGDPMYLEVE